MAENDAAIFDMSRRMYVSVNEKPSEPRESTRTVHEQFCSGHQVLLNHLLAKVNNVQSTCDALKDRLLGLSEAQLSADLLKRELAKDIKDLKEAMKDLDCKLKKAQPAILIESPDAEVPASWGYCCKWLLTVFLCLCIVAMYLIPIMLGSLALHWDMSFQQTWPLHNHQPIV